MPRRTLSHRLTTFQKADVAKYFRRTLKEAGLTQTDLAHLLNVDSALVCQWASGRYVIPFERALESAKVTHNAFSAKRLRPDIYRKYKLQL